MLVSLPVVLVIPGCKQTAQPADAGPESRNGDCHFEVPGSLALLRSRSGTTTWGAM
jgi:hypothetical protein